jgi:hypothetical protein
LVEIGISMKPTDAQIGMAEVIGVSSWTNAKFMAVGVDKNAVSWARGDGVEDVASPLLVTSVWGKIEHVLRWLRLGLVSTPMSKSGCRRVGGRTQCLEASEEEGLVALVEVVGSFSKRTRGHKERVAAHERMHDRT